LTDEEVSISQEQILWCDRLWSSLKIGAKWILPVVGVYTKTSENALSLTELYFSTPTPDAFGSTAFDSHDWVLTVGTILNWDITEDIELARDWHGEVIDEWPTHMIGQVDVCSARCGTIIRAEPYRAGEHYVQLKKSDGKGTMCPTCNKVGFDRVWTDAWVVVDDSATQMRRRLGIKEEE
tara:strand:+ start:3526 stop:4065 length:540 start_codon:yes stop_codon:yes gene_type:complete